MLHLFLFGLFLGWGAAIPIGAINLEMIRRNLHFGTSIGFVFGLGACLADVTYLIILSLGLSQILTQPLIFKITGILGSLILAYFGYMALCSKPVEDSNNLSKKSSVSHGKNIIQAYLLTLINPTTILFWSSVSIAIAANAHNALNAIMYAGLGVLCGTLSWISSLNIFLHFTRHRLSKRIIQSLNYVGGFILLGFAILGFWRAVS